MRNLLFALLLFTSCSAPSNFEGQLSDLTIVEGRATFKLDGKVFENVHLLSKSASRMNDLQGQRVGLRIDSGEITKVDSLPPASFYRGTLVVVAITLALGILLSQLPETNPYPKTIYGGNYGGESWWSNKL